MAGDFESLLEQVMGLQREEIQSIEINTTKSGGYSWTIKMYSLLSEDEKLLQKVFSIDTKLRSHFLQTKEGLVQDIALTPCNKYRDPVICFELEKGAKGEYSYSLKYRSKLNEETAMMDRIKFLTDNIKINLK